MKNSLIPIFIIFACIGFLSCSHNGKQLNGISEDDFDAYIIKGIKEHKKHNFCKKKYLDSIISLKYLKDTHKAKAIFYKSTLYYKEGNLDSAMQQSMLAFQYNKNNVTSTLVDYYYLLGLIFEKKNQYYQSLYYYNRAGEILKRTNIYHTAPCKADVMLIQISLANKYLRQINAANNYIDAAIVKHKKYSNNPEVAKNIYIIKASLFSVYPNLNRDSMDFYLSKAIRTYNLNSDTTFRGNISYIKAEYFYNTHKLDSALYYIENISQSQLNDMVIDEINLLSIYSRKGMKIEAYKQLKKIKNYIDKGMLTASDSILYLENLIDYHMCIKDSTASQKALDNFLEYKENFTDQEIQKNINELSSIMDLQQKDNELTTIKSYYKKTLEVRNKSVIIIIFFLLIGTIILIYLKWKATKRRFKLENQAVNLKMKLLQSQIKPHFIFNTLASIQSLIRLNKTDQSIRYLNSFSDLMRQTLDVSRNTHTTLDKELKLLKTYVEVQKLRKDNFDLEIKLSNEIAAEKEEICLPALSLQPFVENSIIHGFNGINYRGCIQLSIQSDKDILLITITDNGQGLKHHSMSPNNNRSHGIDIIREHLDLLNRYKHTPVLLTVENRNDKNSGVVVRIQVPFYYI